MVVNSNVIIGESLDCGGAERVMFSILLASPRYNEAVLLYNKIYYHSKGSSELPFKVSNAVNINNKFYKRLPRAVHYIFLFFYLFQRFLKSKNESFLVFLYKPTLVASFAYWLAKPFNSNLRLFISERSLLFKEFSGVKVWLLKHLLRWCYNSCDGVIFISKVSREMLIERGFVFKRSIVVPNPVEVHSYNKYIHHHKNIEESPSCIGVINLLVVGRLVKGKGNLQLLDFVAHYNKLIGPKLRLYLVGDGPEREQLVSKANLLGLDESIVFLGRKPHPFDLISDLNIHVFITNTYFESFGNAVLEAAAHGVPVLVPSDVVSFHEIFSVKENEHFNILFYERDNFEDMTFRLERLILNRCSISEYIYRHSLRFELNKIAERYEKFLG